MCSGGSRPPSTPLPLSASQAQLWYLSQLAPDSLAFNELIEIRKIGALDVDALHRALTEVVSRHEAWRTTFDCVDGVPHQFVHEPKEVDLPMVDLSYLDIEKAKSQATEIVTADTRLPFDLAHGPLIRPRLIRFAEDDHRLYLGLHQLIWDRTTIDRVAFPELIALYRSYAMGLPSSMPDPEAQHADYATWELDWVRGSEVAGRIAKWRSRLAGSTPSQLPVDHPRPPGQTFAGGTIPLVIEHATVDGLRRAARAADGTLFHALAAAYAWWLHLYATSTDVVFGSQHDLRDRADLRAVAGNCMTPVALRCGVSGEELFTALIGRIRQEVTDALSDVVPFDSLVDVLGVPRDRSNSSLFHTQLLFQSSPTTSADGWSLCAMDADIRDAVGSAKFDVSIELEERPDGKVVGGFVFSADLFDRETAREMASHWCRLLDGVAAEPGIPMAEHDLVTPDERQRQLSWNRTTDEGISSQCVHELIGSQVERTPDAIAVEVGDMTLTYRQLDDRAAAIACRLVEAGVGTGSVVAMLLDRTPDLVAALLGILKSGAAFLPMDPQHPVAHNTFNITDAGATTIVTDRQLPIEWDAVGATVINLGEPFPPAACRVAVSPSDLAYVIYTSGSTGCPKAVLIEHRGVTNLMRTMFRELDVAASDTVLSVASISFDLALADILCALACGARLVLATAAQAVNPAELSRLIAHSGTTYMMATPTTWGALIATGWGGNPCLTAVSVGETLTDGLAEALLQRCGPVWNGYGPTEATAGTNFAQAAKGDTITVGKSLPNVRAYIIDPRGRLQPVGIPGEIAIGGVGVGRGYLNRPDEHARRFGEDPFHVGGRIYRTGDRGRFLPDGRIQYLGRYDDQLKIRGFRIEPGEIESTLCEHPDVGHCAVVAREAPNGEQQLVAYIVGKPGCPSDVEARRWLRHRLPEYKVPSAFVHLSALPMTTSGKLDKAGLPAPSSRATGHTGAVPPRNDTERRVAALWADLLAKPVTDVNADFFDIGGHSLLAARLISQISREFGSAPSLAAFLEGGRTVAGLAALLGADSASETDGVTSGPPLHFIFSDTASVMSLRHFTAAWGGDLPVHPLLPEQPDGQFDRSVTIEEHARQALSTIRSRQSDGPLALAGYSIGGLVAYEVARQAADAGQQIAWLGIIDVVAPPMYGLHRGQQTLRWHLRSMRRRPPREQWAKCAEVALRVVRSGSPWPERDFDYHGAVEIACRYRQPGHQVPMHLYVAKASAAAEEEDLLGWGDYHKGPLTGRRFAGDHISLLQLPQVEQLARIVLESLCRSRQSTCGRQAVAKLPRAHASSYAPK
jgi:amino acid adenylation domain-containing protein